MNRYAIVPHEKGGFTVFRLLDDGTRYPVKVTERKDDAVRWAKRRGVVVAK